MIDAQRVDFIAVPVQDRERAARFYEDTLGLRRNPNSTDTWVEFETGNVTLALVDPSSAGQPFVPLPFGSVVIRVPDVEAAKAKLQGGRGRSHRRDVGLRRVQRRRLRGLRGERPGRPPPLRAVRGRDDSMIEIQRVDYIRVPVRDIEKAKRFYSEVLGLEQNPNSPGDDWIEYETGNATIVVMTPHTHDSEFAPLPPGTIALRVPDVAAAKATLEAAGVQVNDMWDSGVCHGAGFSDPDGNRILLHHRYAPYPDGSQP